MVCLPWGLPHGISIIWGSIGHDLWDGKENTMERAGIGPIYGGWFALVGISTSVPKNGYLPHTIQLSLNVYSIFMTFILSNLPDFLEFPIQTPWRLPASLPGTRTSPGTWRWPMAYATSPGPWELLRNKPGTARGRTDVAKPDGFPRKIIYKWLMFRIYVSLS